MFIFCRNFKLFFQTTFYFLILFFFLLNFICCCCFFFFKLFFFINNVFFFSNCFFNNNLSLIFFKKFLNVCIPQPYCRHQQQPEHAKHLPVVRKYRFFLNISTCSFAFQCTGNNNFLFWFDRFFSFCFGFMQSLWAAERRHEHHPHAASHQHVLSLFQPKFAPKAMVSLDY